MRRTTVPFLTVLAVLLVAVGGAAAADTTETTNRATGDVGACVVGVDSPCNGPDADVTHPTPMNESTENDTQTSGTRIGGTDGDAAQVGICVVGVDSPCNGHDSDGSADLGSEPIGGIDSEDGRMWIPEDQNRDGEIDDRFAGDGSAGGVAALALDLLAGL